MAISTVRMAMHFSINLIIGMKPKDLIISDCVLMLIKCLEWLTVTFDSKTLNVKILFQLTDVID